MRWSRALALSAFAALTAWPAQAGEVRLSLREGRVSIVARDATVAEIVAEWARVGQVRVVNVETLPRERVTIQLEDVTEDQALDVLLRRAGGYIAAPRAAATGDASRFDRLLIMPAGPPRPAAAQATEAAAAVATETAGEQAWTDDEAATQAAGQAAAAEATANPAKPERREYDGVPASRARAYLAATSGENQPQEAESQGGPPSAALLAFTSPGARPAPPARPMAAGQLTAKRASEPAAPAGPRDRVVTQEPVDPAAAAEASRLGEVAPPSAAVPLPVVDPAVQATFKSRRAVETANPRDFHFPRPQPVVTSPGASPAGAKTPGVPVGPIKPPGGPEPR